MNPVMKTPPPPCGSGLARDDGLKIRRELEALIAGKPTEKPRVGGRHG
ncbi:hypothetical protein SAMN04490207_3533 [Pseudomonas gessardii]|nr:hypothetical protein SAMN04490207_3533 [Pseudomonas gessardii]